MATGGSEHRSEGHHPHSLSAGAGAGAGVCVALDMSVITLRTKNQPRCAGHTASGFPRIREQEATTEGRLFHGGELCA